MVSAIVSLAEGCDDEDAGAEVDAFLSAWVPQVCHFSRESLEWSVGTVRGAGNPGCAILCAPVPVLRLLLQLLPPLSYKALVSLRIKRVPQGGAAAAPRPDHGRDEER